jgi:hypothetical protein
MNARNSTTVQVLAIQMNEIHVSKSARMAIFLVHPPERKNPDGV